MLKRTTTTDEHGFCKPNSELASLWFGSLTGERTLAIEWRRFEWLLSVSICGCVYLLRLKCEGKSTWLKFEK